MTTPTTAEKQTTLAEFLSLFRKLSPVDQAAVIAQMSAAAWRNITARADRILAEGRHTAAHKE